ncbi:fungal specific transcription factor domain-containing protein [Diaporthe amygdali]|uniref:fungal specific transcription factor domain-containing protein n=1 Tax=Phomopsis amygdali TaxID=1214568 RepID=UPI0022FF36CC|nr:fungal specific transcription factor domain-containing protein [Diaporthe amygdali]KAJ0121663.1 fungal specific transcription factor domain-containing protein [Diaporthe amygdali]
MEGSMAMGDSRSNGVAPLAGLRPGSEAAIGTDPTGMARDYQQNFQQLHQQPPPHQPDLHQHYRQQQQQQQIHSAFPPAAAVNAPKPIRRRMRMITSCLECPKLDEASQLRLTEIKEKVGSLERQLERDVAKSGSRGFYQQRILADDVEGEFDEERDLEITPMVALDLTYEDDADGADDVMDLGVQVGKMRLTEKIGGMNRPRISEEIQAGLSGGVQQAGTGFIPPSLSGPPSQPSAVSDSNGPEQSIPDFLRPGASYIPPTSGVLFGQAVQSPCLLTFLPAKPAGDRLLQHYFEAVHPIARCVHRPSFEVQYAGFWEEATAGYEPRASTQAVVFAAWFSAAVALDEAVINRDFGFTKVNLVENMKIGTEVALSKANFLRTTRVETLQAFVMYMIPLCREEVSRAHSVLVGAAVRMAECMGLHRDGSKAYNLNALDTHVRRLIWHQLCFLDIRTCEAQGPKPAIRREDYDTWLPDNCEEDQLTNSTRQPAVSDCWTTTLFSLIRFEVNEMMRIIWADRRKLEARKITLTQVLTKIENFRKRMLENYNHFLDERVPIQRYSKLVMHLLMYRLHVMILHPYYANTANPMPQRLRSVLIMSCITIIEIAIQLDTSPAFQSWRWYSGAYQQYQASLILATEMFYYPNHQEANRIWMCLDYVFDLDCHLPNEEKGRQILTEIMSKMGAYMSMRKMRAPTWTAAASPAQQAVKEDGGDAGAARPAPRPMVSPGQQYSHQLGTGAGSAYQNVHSSNMKEESGGSTTSMPSAPMREPTFSALSTGPRDSGTPSTPQSQQQRAIPGPHQQLQRDTDGPNRNVAGLWTVPPPPPPPPPQPPINSGSPENSSSDGGSVASACLRHGNVAGMATAMASGGATGNVPTANLEGEWSTYQEEAINALFPFDPQTGNFAGFGNPTTIGMNNNSWAQQAQGQAQGLNDSRASRGGYN